MQLMSSLDKNESQFFDHRDPAAIESITRLTQFKEEFFVKAAVFIAPRQIEVQETAKPEIDGE
ncbi:hypothetical protein L0O81_16305, partial [Oliverpabstia sp. DFI.9.49]|nr:hypothetical protein [Oliverpabstia sp. DFI.9.49]